MPAASTPEAGPERSARGSVEVFDVVSGVHVTFQDYEIATRRRLFWFIFIGSPHRKQQLADWTLEYRSDCLGSSPSSASLDPVDQM